MSFVSGELLTADRLNQEIGVGAGGTNIVTTSGTTTSTSYTATLTGSTVPGRTFLAPANGQVTITCVVRCFTSTTAFIRFAPEVRLGAVVGSGTVFQAAVDSKAGVHQTNVQTFRFTTRMTITGLTPNTTYNARLNVMVSAGTGTFADMEIITEALP